MTFIALEFSIYETLLRWMETNFDDESLIRYTINNVKALKYLHLHFIKLSIELKNPAYQEYVDENLIAYRKLYYETMSMNRSIEKYFIDEIEYEMRGKHSHNTSNVLICGALAGGVAGFFTNGMETLTVKKQNDKNFSIAKYMRRPGAFYDAMFTGIKIRTFYYSV